MDRLKLYLSFDRPVDEEERTRFRSALRERGRGVPVAYLVGHREFFALDFRVERGVLVPRPETEHLVEVGIAFLRELEAPVFADVGSGTGCVVVSVLHALPRARAYATDVSPPALETTRLNAERHGVLDRLTILAGDLLAPLAGTGDHGGLDAVLSNPPYVLRDDPLVEPGVRDHEPPEALFVPGSDPLHYVRRLARDAAAALGPGGLLAVEVGAGSAEEARALFLGEGYGEVAAAKDLGGLDRIVHGRRRPRP